MTNLSSATSMHLFFSNATPTPAIYTLSLHDALPISALDRALRDHELVKVRIARERDERRAIADALASETRSAVAGRSEEHTSELSHVEISYAVFCLKKKTRQTSVRCSTVPSTTVALA